jgi:hypothetical protein
MKDDSSSVEKISDGANGEYISTESRAASPERRWSMVDGRWSMAKSELRVALIPFDSLSSNFKTRMLAR